MNIKQLAVMMGATEADTAGFVACLRIWTDQGYTVEQAIARNLEVQRRVLDCASEGASNELSRFRPAVNALAALAVEAFYPQAVAA